MPVSSAMTSSALPGSVYISSPTCSATRPRWPRNSFSRTPRREIICPLAPVSSSITTSSRVADRSSSAAPQDRMVSSSAVVAVALRKRASSRPRWIVDLPASLGPRMMVKPDASSISRSRCRPNSWSCRRVILIGRSSGSQRHLAALEEVAAQPEHLSQIGHLSCRVKRRGREGRFGPAIRR